MKLSIITLNFRKAELTIVCMESLYSAYRTQFETGEFELIIVDNFSEDDSIPRLQEELEKQKYKNYSIFANDKNAGFGAGNNFGAKQAKGEQLLFLNNDTLVKRGLAEMLTYMEEHSDVAILGGPLRNENGSYQSSTGNFSTPLNTFLLLVGGQKIGIIDKNPKNIRQVDWVKGALLMMRKKVFEKLQGFDEKIFMYTEDMELCYRAKKAGYKIFFYPQVDIMHKDQGSSDRTFAIVNIYANLLYFYAKHKNSVEYIIVKILLVSKAVCAMAIGHLLGRKKIVRTYAQALKNIL